MSSAATTRKLKPGVGQPRQATPCQHKSRLGGGALSPLWCLLYIVMPHDVSSQGSCTPKTSASTCSNPAVGDYRGIAGSCDILCLSCTSVVCEKDTACSLDCQGTNACSSAIINASEATSLQITTSGENSIQGVYSSRIVVQQWSRRGSAVHFGVGQHRR